VSALKAIGITFALLIFVALLIASWYIILLIAAIAVLYTLARSYVYVRSIK